MLLIVPKSLTLNNSFLPFNLSVTNATVQQAIKMLEEQQAGAERKLQRFKKNRESKRCTLQKLNKSLETIKYENGIVQAVVDQQKKFQPIAERRIENGWSGNSAVAKKIDSLNSRVNRALGVVTAIRLSKEMVERRQKIVRQKAEKMRRSKAVIGLHVISLGDKKKAIEDRSVQLGKSLSNNMKRIGESTEKFISIRSTTVQTEKEKMEALSRLRNLQIQVRSQRDAMAARTTKRNKTKVIFQNSISSHNSAVDNIRSSLERKKKLVLEASGRLRESKKRILDLGNPLKDATGRSYIITPDNPNKTPTFDRQALCVMDEKLEVEIQHTKNEVEALSKKIAEKECNVNHREKQLVEIRENVENILQYVTKQVTKEETRERVSKEFQQKLLATRVFVEELEKSYQEMLDRRADSHRIYEAKCKEFGDEIKKCRIELEELEAKSKSTEIVLKTTARTLEEKVQEALHQLEKGRDAENASQILHEQLLNEAAPEAIQAILEVKYMEKLDRWKKKYDLKNFDQDCKRILDQYPPLVGLNFTVDLTMSRDKQAEIVLADLKKECNDKKRATQARVQAAFQKRMNDKRSVLELAGRVKTKDRQRQDKNQSWLANTDKAESKKDSSNLPLRGKKADHHRRRRRGSDFYNPLILNIESDADDDNEPTSIPSKNLFPEGEVTTPPPTLETEEINISSTQQSEKKVRWADGDKSRTKSVKSSKGSRTTNSKGVPTDASNKDSGHRRTKAGGRVSSRNHSKRTKTVKQAVKDKASAKEDKTSSEDLTEKNRTKERSRRTQHLTTEVNNSKGTKDDSNLGEDHSSSLVPKKAKEYGRSHGRRRSRKRDTGSSVRGQNVKKSEAVSKNRAMSETMRAGALDSNNKDSKFKGVSQVDHVEKLSPKLSSEDSGETKGKPEPENINRGQVGHRNDKKKDGIIAVNSKRSHSEAEIENDDEKKSNDRDSAKITKQKDSRIDSVKGISKSRQLKKTADIEKPSSSSSRSLQTKARDDQEDEKKKRSKSASKLSGEPKSKKSRTSRNTTSKESSSKVRKKDHNGRSSKLQTSSRGRKKRSGREDQIPANRSRKKVKTTQASQKSIRSSFTADYGGF